MKKVKPLGVPGAETGFSGLPKATPAAPKKKPGKGSPFKLQSRKVRNLNDRQK